MLKIGFTLPVFKSYSLDIIILKILKTEGIIPEDYPLWTPSDIVFIVNRQLITPRMDLVIQSLS